MKQREITVVSLVFLICGALTSGIWADDRDTTDQVAYLERELAGANPGSEHYTAAQKEQIYEQIRMYKNRQASQEESQRIELEKKVERLESDKE